MMAMRNYIRGKDGKVFVNGSELEITQHESTGEVDTESFGTSHTSGKKAVVVGNGQCSGSVQGKLSSQQVLDDLLKEGDNVELKLYLTSDADVTHKAMYRWVEEAIISNVQYASDPNGGNGATFQFNFISSGDFEFKHE